MKKNHEIDYLNKLLINNLEKIIGNLDISLSKDKNIIGITGNEYFEYKTIIETVINLNKKIIYSAKKAIEFTYNDKIINEFNLFKNNEEEFFAYYYIENAMYRISSVWDNLAQIYNIYYSVGKEKDKINYKIFFNNLNQNREFKDNSTIKDINNYFYEKDETKGEGKWFGNHKFLKEYRNKMTHRNSPENLSLNNYDVNLKTHPSFILKRLLEDYNKAVTFFLEIVERIKKDIKY